MQQVVNILAGFSFGLAWLVKILAWLGWVRVRKRWVTATKHVAENKLQTIVLLSLQSIAVQAASCVCVSAFWHGNCRIPGLQNRKNSDSATGVLQIVIVWGVTYHGGSQLLLEA